MSEQLPKHWIRTNLGEICLKPQYGWTAKASSKGDLRYLRTSDINSGNVIWETVPFCEKKPYFEEDFLIKNGDILISRSGSVGISYFVEDIPYKCLFASYLIRFQPVLVNKKYIYYFLQSDSYWNTIRQDKSGVSIPNVNATQLSALELPLPPLKEQNRIVQTLDTVFTKLNIIEKKLANIPKLLEKYRNLILDRIMSDQSFGSVEKKKGSEIFSFITSGSRGWAEYYDEKGSIFLRITNLNRSTVRLDISPQKIKFVNLPSNVEGRRTLVQKNDLLISITADVGMIGIIPSDFEQEGYVNQHIALARPISNVYSPFIGTYLLSPNGQKQFEEKQKGTIKKGLTLQDIKDLLIPLPSYAQQIKIVDTVNRHYSKADKLEEYYHSALQYIKHIKKVIMQKAFTGKLVKTVNDETTVLELLENIKKEQAKLEKLTQKNRSKRSKVEKMEPTNENIYEVLKQSKKTELPSKEVWKKSKYHNDIEKFYEHLRDEIEIKKRVMETKVENGEGSVLSLR